MRNYWLVIFLFCAGTLQAQFVRNSGLTLINSASVAVNGDWDNQGSNITNNGTITISDNWTSTGGYDPAGTGGFALTNSATKQFNHSRQSVGFLVKNGAGNTQVNDRLTVNQTLTLTNGLVSMTGANDTLILKAGATVTASSASYVAGKITRYGMGDLFFPVSIASNYLPITIYQVAGTSPRVTVSVENAPVGFVPGSNVTSLTTFPYVWHSSASGADTASFVEVQYLTSLASPSATTVARVVPGKYNGMGNQSSSIAGGNTKIKSYTRGLKGLFAVAVGAATPLPPPVATAATNIATTGFTTNWGSVGGATSYQLDISIDNFSTFLSGYNSKSVTGTSQSVTALTPGISYQYRVRATNSSGTSDNSNVITATTTKLNQTITFNPLSATTFGASQFPLSASASSGLTVTYTSSNPAVATVSGNMVLIVGAGATNITASQAGNTNYNPAPDVQQPLIVNKANQTISFGPVSDVTVGDAQFTLSASASSGLSVAFMSSTPKVTLNGNVVSIVSAGRNVITASQQGDTNYTAATSVDQSFCIKPAKPVITLSGNNTATPTLTSSASVGNQWFLNGTAIPNATNTTLSVSGAGVYTVQATVDDCVSMLADNFQIIVTGDINTPVAIGLYPNPSNDFVFVTGLNDAVTESNVIDALGKSTSIKSERLGDLLKADISALATGMYVLQISQSTQMYFIKFIKR